MLKKELIPVLHVKSEQQVIKNLTLLLNYNIKKVFIIGHDGPFTKAENLLYILSIVKKMNFWCGVNFLGYNTADILKKYDENSFDALWYDNSFAGIDDCKTKNIYDIKNQYAPNVKLFGGVAFKYCEQPKDLKEACNIAIKYMDVVTTSGEGTGIAANKNKIEAMCSYIGEHKIGIASGITPENINDYPVDYFLVSTGISKDFYNFDENKIIKILEQIKD